MQRMGTYACDPRMHYQEWNFIKFARSVRRERFRKKKKKQGGGRKKGRKSATGFNYRRVSLALTVIRGGDIIPGGISLKRCTSSAKCIVKTSNTPPGPPRLFYTADTLPRFFERAWNTLNLIIRCVLLLRFAPRRILSLALSFLTVQNGRFLFRFDRLDCWWPVCEIKSYWRGGGRGLHNIVSTIASCYCKNVSRGVFSLVKLIVFPHAMVEYRNCFFSLFFLPENSNTIWTVFVSPFVYGLWFRLFDKYRYRSVK